MECGGKTNHDKFGLPFEGTVLCSSGETSISVSKQKDTVTFKHYISLFAVQCANFCCLCFRFIFFSLQFGTIFDHFFLNSSLFFRISFTS